MKNGTGTISAEQRKTVKGLISKSDLPLFHQLFLFEWVIHQLTSVVTDSERNGDILHAQPHKHWLRCRRLMSGVMRWGCFVRAYDLWPQNTLQHTDGVHFLAVRSLRLLRKFGETGVDDSLQSLAFKIHDVGEGLLKMKSDVELNRKTEHDSYEEYMAFRKAFESQPGFDEYYHNAYLLQHCLDGEKVLSLFPGDARVIINSLHNHNPRNSWFFKSHEWIDYVMYAAWQFIERGNRDVMANVMRNCEGKINNVVEHWFPALGKTFWTPEFAAWCRLAAVGGNPYPPEA